MAVYASMATMGLFSYSTSTLTLRSQPGFVTLPPPPPPPPKLRLARSVTTYATISQQPSSAGGKIRGIAKPFKISPEMQDICGVPEIARTQAVKKIWEYIKGNNLQDPENRKLIRCDEKLKKVFAGRDEVGMFEIAGLISPHFFK